MFETFSPRKLELMGLMTFLLAVDVSRMARNLPAFEHYRVGDITGAFRPAVTEGVAYYYESRMLEKEATMLIIEADKRSREK